eukprot:m.265413 g.265413  ORF g.265413 m.265413 type:complete len:76 (+) comp26747_c0_seq2:19-246(+)
MTVAHCGVTADFILVWTSIKTSQRCECSYREPFPRQADCKKGVCAAQSNCATFTPRGACASSATLCCGVVVVAAC